MKVLVIGALGQLGTDLCKAFADTDLHDADLDGATLSLDITQREAVQETLAALEPDVVVNAAAFHNVPLCEEKPAAAFAVNAAAVQHLAAACHAHGARLIHISTDYVFGYGGTRPYTEADLPAPLSIYGASKLAGEHLVAAECPDHAVVRSSGLYGKAPCRAKGGRNFVQTMLHLAATKPEIKVVTDEILTPTYTAPLAKQIRVISEKGEPGLYHVTCNGICSWHEFAKAIFEETSTKVNLLETTSAAFQSPVKRPSYSVLENKHLKDQGLDIMPEWRDALKAYLAEMDRA
jgi:dTDP-4-dehydrorhamnose reductase